MFALEKKCTDGAKEFSNVSAILDCDLILV
jgi:hypothetical protein